MRYSPVMHWLERIAPMLNYAWSGRWPAGHVEAARLLYDHELVVFAEGACTLSIDGREFDCPAGTFAIVPPGRLHVTSSLSPTPVLRHCIHFDWVATPHARNLPLYAAPGRTLRTQAVRYAPDFVPRKMIHGPVRDLPLVHERMAAFFARWLSNEAVDRAMCRGILLEILLSLLYDAGQPAIRRDRQTELAWRVKAVLDQSVAVARPLQERMAELDCSYEHLCRAFRRTFAVPPLQYLNAMRIQRARGLLCDPMARVGRIARQTGFRDPAYFSRIFRQHTGLSPTRYAALHARPVGRNGLPAKGPPPPPSSSSRRGSS